MKKITLTRTFTRKGRHYGPGKVEVDDETFAALKKAEERVAANRKPSAPAGPTREEQIAARKAPRPRRGEERVAAGEPEDEGKTEGTVETGEGGATGGVQFPGGAEDPEKGAEGGQAPDPAPGA
jgi:hypothetical protein